ncbi:type III-B CRISPR module-associated Cmr3 family protein [Myxococcota bacterium]
MKHFFVEPVESLMFGQPRSFAAGEAHRSVSLFPPSPYAFQGLVRSRLLHATRGPLDFEAAGARERIETLVGSPDALKPDWQITGPYPALRRQIEEGTTVLEPWLPVPRFLVRGRAREILWARPVADVQGGLSDLGEMLLFGRPEAGPCKALTGWLSAAALKAALTSGRSRSPLEWTHDSWRPGLPPFVEQELRPGLAITPGGAAARHGLLYFLEALRFAPDGGFWARFAPELSDDFETSALETGMASFGRKGRLVRFGGVAEVDPAWRSLLAGEHLPQEISETELCWLVALSPLRLDDPRELVLRTPLPDGVKLEVRTALTGPPLTLGGFSLARGTARPNRVYVPAGSAWAVGLVGGTPHTRAQALRTLHDSHPFGPPEEAAMGFGHILAGRGPSGTGDET